MQMLLLSQCGCVLIISVHIPFFLATLADGTYLEKLYAILKKKTAIAFIKI